MTYGWSMVFTGRYFGLLSTNNKTDCHDITKILNKVALNSFFVLSEFG